MVMADDSAPGWAHRLADDLSREMEGLRVSQRTLRRTPLSLPSMVRAGLPVASQFPGALVWVPDAAGGGVPVFSDGAAWRRLTDGTAV